MGFRHRLALFLIATLGGVQALTLVVAYQVVRHEIIEQGRRDLATATAVFTRQLDVLSQHVGDGVRVLALDYPLRQAIAEQDRATITSALNNHGNRIGATRMMLVRLDGTIEADTGARDITGQTFPFAPLLEDAARDDSAMSLTVLDGALYSMIVVPVKAPVPIAFIAASVPINDQRVEGLRALSALPTTIALVWEGPNGDTHVAAQTAIRPPSVHLPTQSERGGAAQVVEDRGTEFLSLAQRLDAPAGSPAIYAVFDFPLAEALRPYTTVAMAALIILLLGLAIAAGVAFLIARGMSRPIEALASTTRRIAAGDYTVPAKIVRTDEIGELSTAIAGMARAIGERQLALESAITALEVARDEAVRANKAKSEFLANMSHELRTPLNAIIGFGDMINAQMFGPLGHERYTEYAAHIRDSGGHLLSLIEQVLDLAKVEVGTLEIVRERTSLGGVIKDSIAMLTPTAENAGVVLDSDGADAWPELDGDALKLKQVFINLIGNAVKFTPAGGHVTIACDVDGDVARVRVVDTGIGMREEDIPLVLQPFYRITSAFNARYQGAGLGLPLAKAIVDLHGGALAIETCPGMGTTVTVTLPLAALCASKPAEAA